MKNIYYFRNINHIGGIETFFRELSKKYKDWDITFYYKYADLDQLKEIRKYCRCVRFDPSTITEKIECDKAFFNFNLEMLDYVDAKENILVVHGNYHMLDGNPPMDERIDRVYAVSEDSARAYTEITGIECGVCYNPLVFEKYERPLKLICASRLNDKVKGYKRLKTLIDHLDRYCREHGRNYLMLIFSDSEDIIRSENVAVLKGRIDIRPYMKDSDFLVQLSDNFEGYNYSVNEMLYLFKKPVLITPCNVYEELGIDDSMSIRVNFDMSNVDEAIEKMFTREFKVDYKPPMDRWDELLEKGKSTYKEEFNMKYIVRATKKFERIMDTEVNRTRTAGEKWEVDVRRYNQLADFGGLIELVATVPDEIKTETLEEKPKVKKAVRKTTKK